MRKALVAVVGLVVGTELAAQPSGLREKVAGWQGQRVIVLPSTDETIYVGCTARRDFSEPPYARYAGRTGVIRSVTWSEQRTAPLFRFTVAFDQGDSLVLCREEPLGFFAELDSLRKLIGRPLWTRGIRVYLDSSAQRDVPLENIARVSIASVEWGTANAPFHVTYRLGNGKLVVLETRNVRQGHLGGLDERWHVRARTNWRSFLSQFHPSDPRTSYGVLTPAIWQAVRRGEVIAGMSLEVVELACGDGVRTVGATVETRAGKTFPGSIMNCDLSDSFFKKFVVTEGRVIRILDE